MTFAQARADLAGTLDQVGLDHVVITRPGRHPLAVMELDEYHALHDLVHALRSPVGAVELLQIVAQIKDGTAPKPPAADPGAAGTDDAPRATSDELETVYAETDYVRQARAATTLLDTYRYRSGKLQALRRRALKRAVAEEGWSMAGLAPQVGLSAPRISQICHSLELGPHDPDPDLAETPPASDRRHAPSPVRELPWTGRRADPSSELAEANLADLLATMRRSGHFADAANPDCPPAGRTPGDFGWVLRHPLATPRPQGPCLGWVKADRLWLDPATTHPTLSQSIARALGHDRAPTRIPEIGRLLAASGIDLIHDRGMHTHRVRAGGLRRRVWDLPLEPFFAPIPQ